jgi:hypothetical protein|tara:strand:- start:237 stop:488 length:252 start_codon:yes stop_codon:yes gene_type:complete
MISKNEFLEIVIPKALTLLEERKNSRALESEADFLAGAMFVLTIVNMEFYEATHNESMNIVPPMWIFGPMSGRSVLDEAKDES